MKIAIGIVLRASAVALLLSSLVAASASASPAWKFNGTELSGTETIVGAAVSSGMTISGMETTCEHFLYRMKIHNSSGTGQGEVTEVPLFECHTNTSVCSVERIEPERLPWAAHLTVVGEKRYLVIEGIRVSVKYAGAECALSGLTLRVEGTAGGLIENSKETATFDKASFEATKTKLKVGSQTVEWNGVFPTEAFESHRLQSLEVS